MRTRPWPLVILAFVQMLTPVFNIFLNAWNLQVSPLRVVNWILQQPPLEVFQTVALMPIAGIAIYRMKKWSYPVFMLAMGWGMLSNIYTWLHSQGTISAQTVLLVYVMEIALVSYFLLPSVKATYFDPNVRWWETKPRYELVLPARVGSIEGNILNISEGGAFLSTKGELAHGQMVDLSFSVVSRTFAIPGKIVHCRKMNDQESCYGVQFIHTPDSVAKFRKLINALRELGFQDRDQETGWLPGLVDWLKTLVTTGKGLTPELNGRRGGQKKA